MALPLNPLDALLLGYRLVMQAGTALAERATLNFLAPLEAYDDSGNGRTNVRVTQAASGDPGIVPATTPTTVLEADGTGALVWAKLADAYVDAAAAIAGTKIAPDFGSQDVVTTGDLSLGTSPATAGDLNVDTAFSLRAGAANAPILTLFGGGGDVDVALGGNSATIGDVTIGVPTGHTVALQVAGANVLAADLNKVAVTTPTGTSIDLEIAGAAVLSVTDDQLTHSGATVLEPHTGVEAIVAGTGITAAMLDRTYLRIRGSGGNVDITADPQIAAGADGQTLILQGTDDAATVKLDDGTGLALSASHTLAANDTLTLIYDRDEALWIEISQTTVT